jgi:cation transport ATPase
MRVLMSTASFRQSRVGAVIEGLLILLVESLLTLAVMFLTGLGVIVAAHSPFEDMLSVIGWLVWSVLAAIITTAVVLVLGSPIRLVPAARRWWRANGEFMLAGALLGAIVIGASFLFGQQTTIRGASSQDFELLMPNGWALLAGWFLLSFSCAHLLWPRRWTTRFRRRSLVEVSEPR